MCPSWAIFKMRWYGLAISENGAWPVIICHSWSRQSSTFKIIYSQHSRCSQMRKHQHSLLALLLHQTLDETCIRSIGEWGCDHRAKASISQLRYIFLHPSTRCPRHLSQGCWPGSRISCKQRPDSPTHRTKISMNDFVAMEACKPLRDLHDLPASHELVVPAIECRLPAATSLHH